MPKKLGKKDPKDVKKEPKKDTKKEKRDKKKKTKQAPVLREFTINLHKRLHGVTFKKRAPRAIKEIKRFAIQNMGTKDVRVAVSLNQHLWSQGIRSVPNRVRVLMERKRNEDATPGEEEWYTLVAHVPLKPDENGRTTFAGTVTRTIVLE
eukprot:TRINITY_DN237_c0_g1_i4.p1 TRINITY_DN237_c0_g1~~TRINITY_DN237_c0_g1_i4.p1  ORF type:complete len:150 (+),score=38.38 TRINITY_DN237_c0_g1_i4:75-524(+)